MIANARPQQPYSCIFSSHLYCGIVTKHRCIDHHHYQALDQNLSGEGGQGDIAGPFVIAIGLTNFLRNLSARLL